MTTLVSTSAIAGDENTEFKVFTIDTSTKINASNLIGMRVHSSEADTEGSVLAEDAENEWDDIGEADEIVLNRFGKVDSFILGVGGFLGLGEKDVAVDMLQLKLITEDGNEDDFFIVVKASAAGVKDAPTYKTHMGKDASMNTGRERTGTVFCVALLLGALLIGS